MGRVITGRRYRLSARDLWHASRPSLEDRLLLLGWTPAGWHHIPVPPADMAGLLSLGFVEPHAEAEQQGRLSRWGTDSSVQKGLESFGFRRRLWRGCRRSIGSGLQWGPGCLKHTEADVIFCISSDEEPVPEGPIILD